MEAFMSIRNKVVLGMKAVEIQKNKTWKKVSSYFGENTFNASIHEETYLGPDLRGLQKMDR